MGTTTDWHVEAENRRIRREELGLSLRNLADQIGCSHVQIYRWEKAKAMPRADMWEKWGNALRLECEEGL